jgi:hypothetical protein
MSRGRDMISGERGTSTPARLPGALVHQTDAFVSQPPLHTWKLYGSCANSRGKAIFPDGRAPAPPELWP